MSAESEGMMQALGFSGDPPPDSAFKYNLSDTQFRVLLLELLGGAGGVGGIGGAGGGEVAQGGLRSVPTGTTNGAELTGKPSKTDGVRFYLGDAESVTIFFAAAGSAPGSPPTLTVTLGPFDGGLTVDEPTSSTDTIFVTAKSGTPTYRWIQR